MRRGGRLPELVLFTRLRRGPGQAVSSRFARAGGVGYWFLFAAFMVATPTWGQTAAAQETVASDPLRRLAFEERWQEIVERLEGRTLGQADEAFYLGLALARVGRWQHAREIFSEGERLSPQDLRFPVELAGIAFHQQDYPGAARHIRRALQLDPLAPYANDLAATLHFIEGELEEALKHWNRLDKPVIEILQVEPGLRTDPLLLEKALKFGADSVLQLDEYRRIRARIDLTEVFDRHQLRLIPRPDGRFDLAFSGSERAGWRENRVLAAAAFFRGLPFETVHPEFFNIGRMARNFESLLRWDSQKRRAWLAFSSPVAGSPAHRVRFFLDGRNENWNLLGTFRVGEVAEQFNFRSLEGGASYDVVLTGWLLLSLGSGVTHRRFRNRLGFDPDSEAFPVEGPTAFSRTRLDLRTFRSPRHRIESKGSTELELGRNLRHSDSSYLRLETALETEWIPQQSGEDYTLNFQFRTGHSRGEVPFDRLFNLRLERDNDFGLRGHVGTRRGQKGFGPLGRSYVVTRSELDKLLLSRRMALVAGGPFFDWGRVLDRAVEARWLFDAGLQLKTGIPQGPTVIISYGRNLREGGDGWYLRIVR